MAGTGMVILSGELSVYEMGWEDRRAHGRCGSLLLIPKGSEGARKGLFLFFDRWDGMGWDR